MEKTVEMLANWFSTAYIRSRARLANEGRICIHATGGNLKADLGVKFGGDHNNMTPSDTIRPSIFHATPSLRKLLRFSTVIEANHPRSTNELFPMMK